MNPQGLKSSWKTGEFWLAVAGKIAGLALALYGSNPTVQAVGGLVVGVSTGTYQIGRANVKAAALAALTSSANILATKT